MTRSGILTVYCDPRIETAKRTGRPEVFDAAISELMVAECRIGTTTISLAVVRQMRRMSNITGEPVDFSANSRRKGDETGLPPISPCFPRRPLQSSKVGKCKHPTPQQFPALLRSAISWLGRQDRNAAAFIPPPPLPQPPAPPPLRPAQAQYRAATNAARRMGSRSPPPRIAPSTAD